jgi:hypothetical protein
VTKNAEETVEYLLALTRAIAELPYREDSSVLGCVPKLKSKVNGLGGGGDGDDDDDAAGASGGKGAGKGKGKGAGKKGKPVRGVASGGSRGPATGAEALANTWLHQLQMVPGMGESKAQALVRHFPSFSSLMAAYGMPRTAGGSGNGGGGSGVDYGLLLQDKMGTARKEGALSRKIYEIFTAADGELRL